MTTSATRQALVSFDAEMIPVGFETFDKHQMQNYNETLMRYGDKTNPWFGGDGQFHPDGLAMEFAPIIPSKDVGEFMMRFTELRRNAEYLVGTALIGQDWVDISEVPSFTKRNAPMLWHLAHTLGCSSDYDPSGLRIVPPFIKESPIKEIGFHIHVDLHEKFRTPEDILPCVKDFHNTVSFLLPQWTASRAPWYRAPMVYRDKPYGMEYRSFGASIVNHNSRLEMLVQLAFDFSRENIATHSKDYFI